MITNKNLLYNLSLQQKLEEMKKIWKKTEESENSSYPAQEKEVIQ